MKTIILGLILLSSLLLNPVSAKEQLTATIIGSGSPIYNENRASASTLISAGNTHILVDMGNGTQANLHKLGLEVSSLSSLLFTHHHLDHNEEFVPVFIRSLMGRHNFSIIGPPDTTALAQVNLELYEKDISYRLGKTKRTLTDRKKAFTTRDIQGGESFKIDDVLVTTLKVPHTIHSIAYRFDYKGQSIVITGDLTYSKELPTLAKNADFMIIDSGGMKVIGGRKTNRNSQKGSKSNNTNNDKRKSSRVHAHLNLNDSSTLAQKAKVKNVVYTHFNKGEVDTEASLQEIRKNYSGNVIFSEDLMVIKNNVTVNLFQNIKTRTRTKTKTKAKANTYPIVDTGQVKSYSNNSIISLPDHDDAFFGQDSSYIINTPSYTENNNGTITDNVTKLIWQKEMGEKLSYEEALHKVNSIKLGGYNDWRLPTIKELYSLIQFSGSVKGQKALYPFIDTTYFNQPIGDTSAGEREIDAQTWTSTEYVGQTMQSDATIFGVNFVDGRIKGYPKYNPRTGEPNKMYFRFVRGNKAYGKNHFADENNGTISDSATGLMWQQADSTKGMNWQEALQYAENLTLDGHSDWRLPNAKELQSIVDYTRSPETSNSAAINPIFQVSAIVNENGEKDYPYYWSSTTHLDGPVPEEGAVYIAFGKAVGEMRGKIMDVHGAGSQRSDPKMGEPMSRGPQGDMIRVKNYVRVVRGGEVNLELNTSIEKVSKYKNHVSMVNKIGKKAQKKATNNKFIKRLDKNGDGKVSQSEFKRDKKIFKHLDKNNDGYITVDEAPTGPPKGKR